VTPLQKPASYLDEIAAGIKVAQPEDLPEILRSIGMRCFDMADEIEAVESARLAMIEFSDD
jgi:hypothetical protein